jgi:xanthine dehydrogenase accessory factor
MTFWKNAIEKLKAGQTLILMIVVRSEGSSPGKPGFKMMVAEDDELWGSIGGGNMEYRLAGQCRKMLQQKETNILIKKQDHHPDSKEGNSGMICSGVQWIGFYPLDAKDLDLAQQIVAIEENRQNSVVTYSETGIFLSKPEKEFSGPVSRVSGHQWTYAEQPGLKSRLYIFGAGHVSLALSKMASEVGFDVVVFDNRKAINTFENNIFAYKKAIINYAEADKYVEEGDHIFVVIMTFAHQSDLVVLKQMVQKQIRYLGMMGSELKVDSIFEALLNEGITKKELKKVNAPIGLPINSITPGEIAVSILAKIIQVKNSESSI